MRDLTDEERKDYNESLDRLSKPIPSPFEVSKRVFLYVSGEEYSADYFERHYEAQSFYEEMVRKGKRAQIVEENGYYFTVKIKEFGAIDDTFITFVREIMDTDSGDALMERQKEFYEVTMNGEANDA
ncbi:hypothetical protein [Rossellomorea marisflavi]|uniref:hypothetical protein n=1 Tax=Rossellomorea marisflavi TaxID=189381 RepID=UPI003F9FA171